MAEERPYRLLIRLGVILVPILTAILISSYYHPPGMLSRKPAAVIAAPSAAKTASPFEAAPAMADAVSDPAARAAKPAPAPADPISSAATLVTAPPRPPAIARQPARPDAGAIRALATGSETPPRPPAIPPSALSLSPAGSVGPTAPAASQPAAPLREQTKARDAGKQQPAPRRGTIEKLDRELDRKLSICQGC